MACPHGACADCQAGFRFSARLCGGDKGRVGQCRQRVKSPKEGHLPLAVLKGHNTQHSGHTSQIFSKLIND